jgi:hypothetical protein
MFTRDIPTTPRFKRILRILLYLSVAAVLVTFYFIVRTGLQLNEEIDLCSDETSGSYITDADARKKVCGPD